MNKTTIDYMRAVKGYTWNPVTGCTKNCTWTHKGTTVQCYAKTLALGRLKGRFGYENGFEPTFHPERLSEPSKRKKPSTIFVCDMGDLFNPAIPRKWVYTVFNAVRKAPWHTYLFLTKFPGNMKRYHFPTLPEIWAGVSITNVHQIYYLLDLKTAKKREGHLHRWVSLEPWMDKELADIDYTIDSIEFIAAGSLNAGGKSVLVQGKRVIQRLYKNCKKAGIPLFIKKEIPGYSHIREIPKSWPGWIRPDRYKYTEKRCDNPECNNTVPCNVMYCSLNCRLNHEQKKRQQVTQ